MQPVPLRALNLSVCSSSIAGIRNASVLPLPVRAAPSKSLQVELNKLVRVRYSREHLPPLQQRRNGFCLYFGHLRKAHRFDGVERLIAHAIVAQRLKARIGHDGQ